MVAVCSGLGALCSKLESTLHDEFQLKTCDVELLQYSVTTSVVLLLAAFIYDSIRIFTSLL